VSVQLAREALNLRPVPRPGHIEYCSNEPLVRAVTGRDPLADPAAWRAFYDAWQIDMLWVTNDGPSPWSALGRTTDMGHAEFLQGGRDRRDAQPCPFASAAEAWAFDAVAEYGLPPLDELGAYYRRWLAELRMHHPEQFIPGGYYKTLFSGAIETFGWDMLLSAAADRTRFGRVLGGFFDLAMHYYRAWGLTDAEAFICHDDMVWSQGPFMHPQFYRRSVFPRYRDLWSLMHQQGKKVLFTSDGDYTPFLDDVAAAGADGFFFEPTVDFAAVVNRFGGTHVIAGSKVDCRTLTFGSRDDVKRQVDQTLDLAGGLPGFFFAVGNHIPANVPVENALFYFDYLCDQWCSPTGEGDGG
jgi:hypothetical protein